MESYNKVTTFPEVRKSIGKRKKLKNRSLFAERWAGIHRRSRIFLLLIAENKGTIDPLIRGLEEPERGVPKCF